MSTKYSVMSLKHPVGYDVYLVDYETWEHSPKYGEIKAMKKSGEKTIQEIWPLLQEGRKQFKKSDRRIIVSRDRGRARRYEVYPCKSYWGLQEMMKKGQFIEV